MASLRRKAQKGAVGDSSSPPPSPVHDDQLDADDMASIGFFLLSRRESGATIDDPEELFPAYSMGDVYGIHSGMPCHNSSSHLHRCRLSSRAGQRLRPRSPD
jgi:hypothetical protein